VQSLIYVNEFYNKGDHFMTNENMFNSTTDKVKGTINSSLGAIKETAGHALNNKDLESEGTLQKVQGKGQQLLAEVKDTLKDAAHALGDTLKKI
jgi:uncharacterized protein YjbJ (UPF0337 family)